MILRQYNLKKHFISPTWKRRCTIDHKPGSDPGLRHMGRQARATTEASFDSNFLVEKGAFHRHVPHGSPFICSHTHGGALLQSLVSLPVQSV